MVKIYTTDGDFIIDPEILYEEKDFFKKMSKPNCIREKKICEILMKNPHKNIISIYDIGTDYINMELLNTNMSTIVMSNVINVMTEVKTHLQNLGIMYIDWKLDNIGISDDGQIKLFDFDGSGLINIETKEWIIDAPKHWWSYNNAIKNGMKNAVDIDNYVFDIEFNKKS